MDALHAALGLVAALVGGVAPPTPPSPRIERAACPPAVAGCRTTVGRVVYVETYDTDGDGDVHYVLIGGDVTAPGLSVIDVAPAMQPRRLPRSGDEVSAAGPVEPGTYGQHQIHATEIHYLRRRR